MKNIQDAMFNFVKNLFKKDKAVPAVEEVKEAHPVSIVKHKLDVVKKVDPLVGIRKNVASMVKYVYKSKKYPTDNLARYLLKNHMPNLSDERIKPVYNELKEVQDFLRVLSDVGSSNERIQRQLRDKVGDDLKTALAKLNEMVK